MTMISGQRLRAAVAAIAPEVSSRVAAVATPKADELSIWQELSCCVLSSQVPYELALAASERVHPFLAKSESNLFLEEGLYELLLAPLPTPNGYRRYRFPRLRARQLAVAKQVVESSVGSISNLISQPSGAVCTRPWLISNIPGLGPKQASMFLRNVGVTQDLAIIDRHIVRYMSAVGLAKAATPPTAMSDYERRERSLQRHAKEIGHSLAVVDWSIWIVMRAASQLQAA